MRKIIGLLVAFLGLWGGAGVFAQPVTVNGQPMSLPLVIAGPTATAGPTPQPTVAPTATPIPTAIPSSTATPSPNNTVVIGTNGRIVDVVGNTWAINSTGKVVINGVVDITTGNVVELAYVNWLVWQNAPWPVGSTNNMWWSKASPIAPWLPPGGTSTSPLGTPAPTASPTGVPIAHFSTLGPNASLPSGSACATLVNSAPLPEVVPANAPFNSASQIPTPIWLAPFYANPQPFKGDTQGVSDYARVDGNYSGSTDMIIRWAACKYGIDEDVIRAQAQNESFGWLQAGAGDKATTQASCVQPNFPLLQIWNTQVPQPGGNITFCPNCCYQSWGLVQNKLFYEPTAWPIAMVSTAFGLDLNYAETRSCMNGNFSTYFSSAAQQPNTYATDIAAGNIGRILWGCIGKHLSGGWYDVSAQTYIAQVQAILAARNWP